MNNETDSTINPSTDEKAERNSKRLDSFVGRSRRKLTDRGKSSSSLRPEHVAQFTRQNPVISESVGEVVDSKEGYKTLPSPVDQTEARASSPDILQPANETGIKAQPPGTPDERQGKKFRGKPKNGLKARYESTLHPNRVLDDLDLAILKSYQSSTAAAEASMIVPKKSTESRMVFRQSVDISDLSALPPVSPALSISVSVQPPSMPLSAQAAGSNHDSPPRSSESASPSRHVVRPSSVLFQMKQEKEIKRSKKAASHGLIDEVDGADKVGLLGRMAAFINTETRQLMLPVDVKDDDDDDDDGRARSRVIEEEGQDNAPNLQPNTEGDMEMARLSSIQSGLAPPQQLDHSDAAMDLDINIDDGIEGVDDRYSTKMRNSTMKRAYSSDIAVSGYNDLGADEGHLQQEIERVAARSIQEYMRRSKVMKRSSRKMSDDDGVNVNDDDDEVLSGNWSPSGSNRTMKKGTGGSNRSIKSKRDADDEWKKQKKKNDVVDDDEEPSVPTPVQIEDDEDEEDDMLEATQQSPFWNSKGMPISHYERVARAAMHIQDAVYERPIKIHRTGIQPVQIYLFITSAFWTRLIQFASLCHLLLVLWEPPSYASSKNYYSSFQGYNSPPDMDRTESVRYLMGVEFVIICIYCLDIILSLYSMGLRDFLGISRKLKKTKSESKALGVVQQWERAKVICFILFALDLFMAIASPVGTAASYTVRTSLTNLLRIRFSRILRPVYFVTVSREQRRWAVLIMKTIPKIVGLALLIFSFIAVYAIIGVLMFSDKEFYSVDKYQNFNTFGRASVALYVLMTSENYPQIMYPAYEGDISNGSRFYAFYFISFVLIMMLFLANLAVPYLYRAFRTYRSREALQARILQRVALLAAFQLLDMEWQGYIELQRFQELLRVVKPDLFDKSGNEIDDGLSQWMFHELAKTEQGKLTPVDFFGFCDYLEMDIEGDDVTAPTNLVYILNTEPMWSKKLRRCLRPYLRSRAFEVMTLLLTTFNTIALAAYGSSDYKQPILIVSRICIMLFFSEMILKLYCLGWDRFRRNPNNLFDLVVILAAFSTGLIEYNPRSLFGDKNPFQNISSIVICLRVLRLIPALGIFRRVQVLLHVIPFMTLATALLFLVVYGFSIIGMEAFAELVTHTTIDPVTQIVIDDAIKNDAIDPTVYADDNVNFDNFGSAILVLFQVLTGSDWHEIMYNIIWSTDDMLAPSIYFIAYHFIVVMLILQLMIAIYVDAFEAFQDKEEQEQKEAREEVVVTAERPKFTRRVSHIISPLNTIGRVGMKEFEEEEVQEIRSLGKFDLSKQLRERAASVAISKSGDNAVWSSGVRSESVNRAKAALSVEQDFNSANAAADHLVDTPHHEDASHVRVPSTVDPPTASQSWIAEKSKGNRNVGEYGSQTSVSNHQPFS